MLFFAFWIVINSVASRWHYLVDLPAGVLLAAVVIVIANWVCEPRFQGLRRQRRGELIEAGDHAPDPMAVEPPSSPWRRARLDRRRKAGAATAHDDHVEALHAAACRHARALPRPQTGQPMAVSAARLAGNSVSGRARITRARPGRRNRRPRAPRGTGRELDRAAADPVVPPDVAAGVGRVHELELGCDLVQAVGRVLADEVRIRDVVADAERPGSQLPAKGREARSLGERRHRDVLEQDQDARPLRRRQQPLDAVLHPVPEPLGRRPEQRMDAAGHGHDRRHLEVGRERDQTENMATV